MFLIFLVLVLVFLIIAQISKKFITRSIDSIQTRFRYIKISLVKKELTN